MVKSTEVLIEEASCKEDLLNHLSQIDIRVGPRHSANRNERRSTKQRERYTLCRQIATMAVNNLLKFPVTITHRDNPDFEAKLGSSKFGIEVTEGVTREAAKHQYKMESENSADEVYILEHEQIGCADRKWAELMFAAATKKVGKCARYREQGFPDLALSIYDNFDVIDLDGVNAAKILQDLLVSKSAVFSNFQKVLIECQDRIMPLLIIVSPTKIRHFPISDIWTDQAK